MLQSYSGQRGRTRALRGLEATGDDVSEVGVLRVERTDELRDMVEGLNAFLSFLVMEGLPPSPVPSSLLVSSVPEGEEARENVSEAASPACCDRRCSILLSSTAFELPRFMLSFAIKMPSWSCVKISCDVSLCAILVEAITGSPNGQGMHTSVGLLARKTICRGWACIAGTHQPQPISAKTSQS